MINLNNFPFYREQIFISFNYQGGGMTSTQGGTVWKSTFWKITQWSSRRKWTWRFMLGLGFGKESTLDFLVTWKSQVAAVKLSPTKAKLTWKFRFKFSGTKKRSESMSKFAPLTRNFRTWTFLAADHLGICGEYFLLLQETKWWRENSEKLILKTLGNKNSRI